MNRTEHDQCDRLAFRLRIARLNPQPQEAAPMPAARPLAMTAENVKAARETLGLVQEELAPRLHVSLRTIKRYEAEGIPLRRHLQAKHLQRMARAKAKGRKPQ